VIEQAELPVDNGVLISEVVPGSPADKAGLRGGTEQVVVSGMPMLLGGDIVIAIDQEEVRRFDDVVNHLAVQTSVGDVVTLTVVRDNQQIEIDVTLEERPSSP
jgi:2-alkenal reductase